MGGASNTGGAVLRRFFSDAQLAELTQRMDASSPTGLDYYPLTAPGERFPVNDPALQPRLEPRPADDAVFLQVGGLRQGESQPSSYVPAAPAACPPSLLLAFPAAPSVTSLQPSFPCRLCQACRRVTACSPPRAAANLLPFPLSHSADRPAAGHSREHCAHRGPGLPPAGGARGHTSDTRAHRRCRLQGGCS